jgi:hypothetical protein
MTGPSSAEAARSEPMPLGTRVDAFMSSHPRAMLAVTIAAAIVATLALLGQPQGAIVLYQAF